MLAVPHRCLHGVRSPFVPTGLCTLHVTPKPKSSSTAFSCLTATLCTFSRPALQVRYRGCAHQPFLGIGNSSASSPSEIISLTLYVRADKIMCLRSVCNLVPIPLAAKAFYSASTCTCPTHASWAQCFFSRNFNVLSVSISWHCFLKFKLLFS